MESKFTSPKTLSPFFNCRRVPRKFKKKWKHILQRDRHNFLDLNQKLWFILGEENKEYRDFLISKIIQK